MNRPPALASLTDAENQTANYQYDSTSRLIAQTYLNGTEGIVKMWYHHDRLGSTAYLMDNVVGVVESFVS